MMLPMDHTGKILPIYSSMISTMIVLTICSSKPLLV